MRMLTENTSVLPFTDSVAIKAAQLYHQLKRQNKMIEFRDIFIAATCIVNELPLITLNKKHFNRIEELKLV
jgi:tRNA(fMet)-specific endonuclease VapC